MTKRIQAQVCSLFLMVPLLACDPGDGDAEGALHDASSGDVGDGDDAAAMRRPAIRRATFHPDGSLARTELIAWEPGPEATERRPTGESVGGTSWAGVAMTERTFGNPFPWSDLNFEEYPYRSTGRLLLEVATDIPCNYDNTSTIPNGGLWRDFFCGLQQDLEGFEGIGPYCGADYRCHASSMCSGVLLSENEVLTAGHCLIDEDSGDLNVQKIEFVPASSPMIGQLEGGLAGMRPGKFANPYGGSAYAALLDLAPGYPEEESKDFAVIRFRRRVGALTGWVPYATANNCSTLRNGNYLYSQIGWPWELGSFATPYRPHQAYQRAGDYESCAGGWAYAWWAEDQVGGGFSGAGSVQINVPPHYVRAVHVGPGNNSSISARIREGERQWLDTFVGSTRPESAKLYALTARSGPVGEFPKVQYPTQTLNADYYDQLDPWLVVFNGGKTAFEGDVRFRFYLLPDLSTLLGAIELGGFTWHGLQVPALTSYLISDGNFHPDLPDDLPDGEYYLGASLETSDGSTVPTEHVFDHHKIVVGCEGEDCPQPDLDVSILELTPAFAGSKWGLLHYKIENVGDAKSKEWQALLLAEKFPSNGGGGVALAQGTGPAIEAGDAFTQYAYVWIGDLSIGNWRPELLVYSPDEAAYGNNLLQGPVFSIVPPWSFDEEPPAHDDTVAAAPFPSMEAVDFVLPQDG